MSADLTHVETWLFDLDNTLYPAECEFMLLVEGRMTEFVARETGLPAPEALALQKKYLHEHGTTLAGLMANHGVDPERFLEEVIDLGFVGEPTHVDPQIIEALIYADHDYVPVIAPIGVSEEGETYNINADTVAGALAGALKAKRMLLLTDVAGVLDANGELVRQMTVAEARKAIADGVATGGMIPKLETAIAAVESGVDAVVILDGRRPHAMLVELFTEHGAGTLVKRD